MARQMNEKKGTYEKRRKQAFRNATTPILEAVIDRLAAQWPCEVPTAASVSSVHRISVYLDVNKVIHKVGPRFKAWYDNLQFFHYLERIGRIISTQSVTQIEVSTPQLKSPSAIPSTSVRYVTQNDLFTGAGPTVTNNSAAVIDLDQLVLRKNVASSNDRLRTLVGRLEASAADSKYEKAYVNGLRVSSFALQQSQNEYILRECDSTQQDLVLHLRIYRMQVDSVFELLVRAVSPQSIRQLGRATFLWSVKQWPRVSSTFFLEQLKRSRWSALSSHWRDAIVQYGIALTAFQRAERLLNVVRSGSDVDLISELRNTGHVNWSPHDYPESLLLEVESGVMIREVQEQIASQMRDSKGNAVMQLNMGEGKSSLIVPIVAADLANGSQLVRVVVAKPQSKQMAQMMISKLGGLLDRRVYYMPFSRALKLDKAAADAIDAMLQECMSNGGILLVQPEHILSFKLMALETGILGEESISKSLLRSQDFFDGFSRDLVDESDENVSVKFELIYTIGSQRPVEMSPGRWMCIHEILGLVRRFSQLTANELPGSVELTHCLPGRFPRTRILKADAQDHLFLTVALHLCTYGFNGFPIARQSQAVRDAVFKYIVKFDLTLEEIQSVEHTGPESFWTESTKEMLLLLRGLFAAGVLSFVFGQKRWRVNYGLDSSRTPDTKLAVPYRAKDNPSPRSEFSHPDVIIMLTTLSYYYGGLSKDDLATAFDHLTRSDQADTVFQAWVKDAHDMPAAFSQLQGINLRDKHQFAVELLPRLRFGKATIDYFLANIVFPKEMKEFPHKLSASGWDIGKCKALPTTGFSGTNDSREVLPLFVEQIDLPAQKNTNALVLDYLLLDENTVAEIPVPTITEVLTSDAERFLNMVMKLSPPARVILDVGTQILELSNLEVAKRWLALSDVSVQAVVFFDEHDELSVVNRKDRVEVLQTSSFATQLDVCLVFLDESHTRGTDLRLPETYRAAVTLGAGLTKDRLTQACMRMRKLGKGQTEVFCVPAEIAAKISLCTAKPAGSWIEVSDILHWTISETWEAKAFLEDEAQSLEDRYRPSVDPAGSLFAGSDHADIKRIEQRCLDFENLSFLSTALQEEQERELSPEIEQERQVQRPASAQARKHRLHPDLVRFVATSILPPGSQAWQPAFSTLSDTTAATYIDLAEFSGDSNHELLATIDFARTIETGKSGLTAHTDAYQRPVQWVLTAIRDGVIVHMLVVSPFEAQELYSRVHTSDTVALHLYAPRCNSGFRSLDRLDFYTVPHQVAAPMVHPRLVVQLNLFAGQLYINDYEDFEYLCGYLGLAAEVAPEGWEVTADGFILKRGQEEVGGANSRLTKSPVRFL
ncbi:hypothetical protein B0A55_11903 [Friedmanniomyces simplex]|uniref:ubiquitinyl hydrolase 1 n=1 Tax=Friedmanniomyces simplex TaxID=329884 RepID=A0A4V5NF37_9PEZI|nr:hypothetical protein B0A55_11903 [Friedmanniomyces simplex]